jgi:hypothetical protein
MKYSSSGGDVMGQSEEQKVYLVGDNLTLVREKVELVILDIAQQSKTNLVMSVAK